MTTTTSPRSSTVERPATTVGRKRVRSPSGALKLPANCYALNPADPQQIVLLTRSQMGYRPVGVPRADAAARVAKYNADLGVNEDQVMAMLTGSMFGFDAPGADPEYVRRERLARVRRPKAKKTPKIKKPPPSFTL
jgi:hypothetical protein